ncbi:MAG: BMC domain-containing protein [Oscillospiraceae bacterium]|nr:BMC domain-containing protein [Oscillospiraceae bacterium]
MREAVGSVETRGLAGAIAAADAMLKSAKVSVAGFRVVGSGLVAVLVSGDVAAVQTAVNSGLTAAERLCEVISVNVIARPHEEVDKLLM